MHSKIPLLSIRRGIDKVFSIQMNNKKSYRGTYLRTHENRYPWQLFYRLSELENWPIDRKK